jgi:hypothetical protein
VEANPTYRPEPPPFAERHPWVIYLVLGAASMALAGILGVVARETVRRHDAREAAPPTSPTEPGQTAP